MKTINTNNLPPQVKDWLAGKDDDLRVVDNRLLRAAEYERGLGHCIEAVRLLRQSTRPAQY